MHFLRIPLKGGAFSLILRNRLVWSGRKIKEASEEIDPPQPHTTLASEAAKKDGRAQTETAFNRKQPLVSAQDRDLKR